MSTRVHKNASERDPLLAANNIKTSATSESILQPQSNCTENRGDGDIRSTSSATWHASGLVPKLGATMFDFFTTGCAMAAVGALIPDIESRYETNDGITAFIFPAGMIGYVGATASVQPICLRFGPRGIAIASPVVRLFAALLLATEPAFGVLLIAYVCLGYGTGLTDTAWNTWASSMTRPNVLQGLLHGSFSLGCVLGPIFAVAILRQHSWSRFYLVIVLMSCVELLTQGWAFRHETAQPRPELDTQTDVVKPRSLLQHPAIWICGVFYFVYQGVEATFTGWIVVFMLRVREADPIVASLASSTFWIGMTVGRYALGLFTERYGVSVSVAVYITLALGFQLMLNLVTDIKFTVLLLAANGVFVAPLFPSGIVFLVSRLQNHQHMPAVALLIALGQVGGAMATLTVGFMAESFGIRHLFELMCGLSAIMLIAWIALVRVG